MGGSGRKGDGTSSGAGATAGGGAGGGVDPCPPYVTAILVGPSGGGVTAGDAVEAVLIASGGVRAAAVRLSASGRTIGTLAGIPNLAQLIACLADGVTYIGTVTGVAGGAINVRLARG